MNFLSEYSRRYALIYGRPWELQFITPPILPRLTFLLSEYTFSKMECLPWYSCFLCGSPIRDNKLAAMSWQRRFRVRQCVLPFVRAASDQIYTVYFAAGFRISGVGIYNKEQKHAFIVSIDTNACSSDQGCSLVKISVMDKKEDDLRGFIFHDSCWSLLKQCNQNRPIQLDRLFDIFRSVRVFPSWCRCPCWGQYYGGLFSDRKVGEDSNAYYRAKRDTKSMGARNSHRDPFQIP